MYPPVHLQNRSASARQRCAQTESRKRGNKASYLPILSMFLWLALSCAVALPLAALPARAADSTQTLPTATPGPTSGNCRPTLTRDQVSQQIGLTGTGMFIWKLSDAEGGNPAAIAAVARNAALSFVMIKVADGVAPYRIDTSTEAVGLAQSALSLDSSGAVADTVEADAERQVVETLQAAGIKVWGWHFIRGDEPQEEARQAIQRIQVLALDGYALVAEAEFEQAGKSRAAEAFMQTLRKSLPDFPVALSSYAYPSIHPEFPLDQFLCQVDLVMPQVYWIGAHNPDEQLNRAVREYSQRAALRPIAPIGAAFSESGWRPTANEISLFRSASLALGQPAVSYWSWDEARSPGNEDLWAAISGRSTWPLYTLDNGWLTSSDVQALAYMHYDKPELLVATAGDTIKIDGRAPQTWPSNLEKALSTRDILATDEHGILLATDGGIWQLTQAGVGAQQTQASARRLALSGDDRLWAASEYTLTRYALPLFEVEAQYEAAALGLGEIRALEVSGDRVWIGGEGGLALLEGDQITPVALPAGLGAPASVNALEVAPEGSLWLGSDSGAARWDGEAWQVFTPANGLASPFINDIALDGAGGVWFATQAGAIRYDPVQKTWRRYHKSAYPVVPSDHVRTILVDEYGTVWLGTDGGVAGLQGQPGATFVYQHDGRGPASNRITALLQGGADGQPQGGNLWLGSLDAGLSVRLAGAAEDDGASGEWRYFDRDTSLLPDNQVTALLVDEQGRAWAGTPSGAVICDLDGCQPIQADPALQITDVRLMALDAQGYTWIATGRSLAWCHPGCEAVSSIPGQVILMEAASDGSMWIVTADPAAYVCRGLECRPNGAILAFQAGQSLATPRALLAGEDGAMLVVGDGGQVYHCAQESCTPLPLEPDLRVIGLGYGSFGQLWALSTQRSAEFPTQAQLHLCTPERCTAQEGNIQADFPLGWLTLAPGPAGEMWIDAGQAGIYFCQTLSECARVTTKASQAVNVLAPAGQDRTWLGDQNNGLQLCTPERCLGLPASSLSVQAYEPSPGLPWVLLTANATLYQRDKLVDIRDLLLEFEGGSLTSPAHELSYQVIITNTQTGEVIANQYPRGSVVAASAGRFEFKEMDYQFYEVRLSVEDPLGKRDEYIQQFDVQASPLFEKVDLLAQPDEKSEADLPAAVTLPESKSYTLNMQIRDPDSTDEPFTIAYRWIVKGSPQEDDGWQTLAERQHLPNGRYSGQVSFAGPAGKAATFELAVTDSDSNQNTYQLTVSFETPRPLWVVISTYAFGAFTVIALVFSGLMRYTGLPAGVLASQGINVFTVGLGYRNFHRLWASRTPLERLLLLLAPPEQPFKPQDLQARLESLETPIGGIQVERALEMLGQFQFLERSGEIYSVTEPAQVSALQRHQGLSGISALCEQIRSEHPLYAEAARFMNAAGFDSRPIPGLLAFICAPTLPSWQKIFDRPIYTRIFPGAAIDHRSVIQAYEQAQAYPQCSQEVVFAVVDQTPSDSAWLQIGTLRAENVQVIPIDDALIQSGREQQKESQALQFHLRRFLGRRRDLYNVRDPVADRLNFFGREAQAGELLEIISEGHPVLMLALRKMGKSSLLLYLRDKAPFPVSHVDLQAGSEPAGLYARMIESLQRSLRVKFPQVSWNPPEISRMQGSEPAKVAEAFAEAVRDLMIVIEQAGHVPQVGLFIDEIEVIVPPEPEGASRPDAVILERYLAFARMLRGLLQETGQLALLAVGVDPRLNHINRWAAEQNPFYQFFREEYLGPLSAVDCIQMVRNIGQQMGLVYTDEALEYIADLSGGHPFLARQLCSLAVRELGEDPGGALTYESIQTAAERFVRDPNTESLLNERGLWGEATNPELWSQPQIIENQIILTSLAESETLPEEDLLRSGRDPAARERSLFELKQRYVLNKVMAALRIQFALFRNWIWQYKRS
ncbi:MAG: hypothetical protein JXA78_07295 [Anaerolineales bacterium]|nr:hypothetical protein [Anaerolineales bacterium]